MIKYDVNQTYELKEYESCKNEYIEKDTYEVSYNDFTNILGDKDSNEFVVNSYAKYLFSDIPIAALNNSHYKLFFYLFCQLLRDKMIVSIDLPKFNLIEMTDSIIEIEWIFHFFRFYFDFDSNGVDGYSYLIKNISNGQLTNSSRVYKMDELQNIIINILNFVIINYK